MMTVGLARSRALCRTAELLRGTRDVGSLQSCGDRLRSLYPLDIAPLWMAATATRKEQPDVACQSARKKDPLLECAPGVRPCGWTKSSWRFDPLPGVLILELGWADVT